MHTRNDGLPNVARELCIQVMVVARVIEPDSCYARDGCSACVSDNTLELKLISFSNRLGLSGLE